MSIPIYYINGKQQFNSDISFNNLNTQIQSSQSITISGGTISLIGPTTINGSSAVTQITNNSWSGKNYFSDDTSVNKLYLTNTGLTTINYDKWVNIDNSNKVVFVDLSSNGNYTSFGGHSMMKNKTAWGSSAIGYDALRNISSRTDISFSNTAVGTSAMQGSDLVNGITGLNNTAVGRNALSNITTGSSNIAIGANALSTISSGSNNTIIGTNSNSNMNGSNSQIIGFNNSANHTDVNIIGTGITTIGPNKTFINNIDISNSTTSNIITYDTTSKELTYCTNMIQKCLNNTQFISQQGIKLSAIDYFGSSLQGKSIAMSSDRFTLAVGGPGDNGNFGAVWIWKRSGSVWTKQEKLVATDISGTSSVINQGISIAMSSDGNTLAVGGTGDNNGVGAVWIWTRASFSNPYSRQQKIIGTSYISSSVLVNQGCSVSLTTDGNTLAFGGLGDNNGLGATWVWTRSSFGQSYTQLQKIIVTGSVTYFANVNQGCSVSLSHVGGNTLAIGGTGDSTNEGAVWIWTRSSFGQQFTQQGSKLVGTTTLTNVPNVSTAVNRGSSVDLSDDGNTLAYSGIMDNGGVGAVWVFTRTGSTWTQQGTKIVGSGSIGYSSQGNSLALSGDGNTLVFGGQNDAGGIGAVWVWSRSAFGQLYYQQGQKLVGSGNNSNGSQNQGSSIILSSDGTTLVVGGSSDNSNIGSVWVYPKITNNIYMGNSDINNSQYTTIGSNTPVSQTSSQIIQNSRLVALDVIGNSQQGHSVSISSDGNTMAVGSPNDDSGDGAVWIWKKVGSVWSKYQKISGDVTSYFGYSVAFQSGLDANNVSGGTLAVGAPFDDSIGGVYIFVWDSASNSYISQGNKIFPADNGGINESGCSVALSSNGNTLVFGGRQHNSSSGAIWVWVRNSGTGQWSQQGTKITGSPSSSTSLQGYSVAISGDGNTIVSGGPGDTSSKGAVWVFTRSGTTWTQRGDKLVGISTFNNGYQGQSVAITNDGLTIAVGAPNDMGGLGSTFLFTRANVNDAFLNTSSITLTGTGYVNNITNQGYSVAFSSDGLTLVIGGKYDNNYIGAIWVWTRSAIGKPFYQYGPKVVGSGNIGKSQQGYSVAVSSDGNTILSGGFGDNTVVGLDGGIGAVWVFTKNSTNTSVSSNNQYMSIGSITPTAPLTVSYNSFNGGSAVMSSCLDMYNYNIGGTFQRYFSNNQSNAWWHVGSEVGDGIENFPFHIFNQNGTGVYISSGSQSWTGYSDARLKKNIKSIDVENAYSKIMQLNPVTYNLLTDSENNQYKQGLIAQDVLSIFPQIISMNHGYYGIGYTELIPFMIASAKHQSTIAEKQEEKIKILNNKLNAVVTQNDSIIKQNASLKIQNDTLTSTVSALESRLATLEQLVNKMTTN
jgi:hypothetical protein